MFAVLILNNAHKGSLWLGFGLIGICSVVKIQLLGTIVFSLDLRLSYPEWCKMREHIVPVLCSMRNQKFHRKKCINFLFSQKIILTPNCLWKYTISLRLLHSACLLLDMLTILIFLCQDYWPKWQWTQEDQEEQDDCQGICDEEGAPQGPGEGAVVQHAHCVSWRARGWVFQSPF